MTGRRRGKTRPATQAVNFATWWRYHHNPHQFSTTNDLISHVTSQREINTSTSENDPEQRADGATETQSECKLRYTKFWGWLANSDTAPELHICCCYLSFIFTKMVELHVPGAATQQLVNYITKMCVVEWWFGRKCGIIQGFRGLDTGTNGSWNWGFILRQPS